MTLMVATSGRSTPWSFSVCIFSYARRTQPPTWREKVLIDWDVTDPHFIAVRRNTDRYQVLRIFRHGLVQVKIGNASHTAARRQCVGAGYRPETRER